MVYKNPRITIRTKVYAYAALLFAVIFVMLVLGYFQFLQQQGFFGQNKQNIAQLDTVHEINEVIHYLEFSVEQYSVTRGQTYKKNILLNSEELRQLVASLEDVQDREIMSDIASLREISSSLGVHLQTVVQDVSRSELSSNALLAQVYTLLHDAGEKIATVDSHINERMQSNINVEEERIQTILVTFRILALLLLCTSIVASVYFARKISRPIRQLRDVADQIGQGNLGVRVEIKSNDEIGDLATTFNHMAENLSRTNTRLENLVQELAREKNKLDHIAQNMDRGAVLLDKKGTVLFVNAKAYEMLGLTTSHQNTDVLEVMYKKFAGYSIEEQMKKCLTGEESEIDEITVGRQIFRVLFKCLSDNPLPGDKYYGHLIWIIDITDVKLLERSKSDLVAIASHQLRTPLTVTRGNVEMLLDESFGLINSTQKELLGEMSMSTVRLISMVNAMLDIAKIEKQELELANKYFDVREALKPVIENLKNYAHDHGVEIISHETDQDVTVYADVIRTQQVFQNLIDNAIRYSREHGKIEVSFAVQGDMLEVTVRDNGIGIPKEEHDKLFGRFYRATNAQRFSSSGSGLGLFIVKSTVEQMGGTVRFESEENKGTTFIFTLPQHEQEKGS